MIRSLTVLTCALSGGGQACARARIAGVEALVAAPRTGAGPVVVYANAATPRGVDEQAVGQLLGGLREPASWPWRQSSRMFAAAR